MSNEVEDLKRFDLQQLLPLLENPHLRYAEERHLEEPMMFALGWKHNGKFWRREGNHYYDMRGFFPFWKIEDSLKLASEHLGVIAVTMSIDDYKDGGDTLIPKSNHECWAEIKSGDAIYRGVGRCLSRAICNATIRGVLGLRESPPKKRTWFAK